MIRTTTIQRGSLGADQKPNSRSQNSCIVNCFLGNLVIMVNITRLNIIQGKIGLFKTIKGFTGLYWSIHEATKSKNDDNLKNDFKI